MPQPPRLPAPDHALHRPLLRHSGAVLSRTSLALALALAAAVATPLHAQAQAPAAQAQAQGQGNATSAAKAIGDQVRAAVRGGIDPKPQTMTVEVPAPPASRSVAPVRNTPAAPVAPLVPRPRVPSLEPLPPVFTPPGGIPNPAAQREALRARAAAMAASAAETPPPAVRGQTATLLAPAAAAVPRSGPAAGTAWSYEGAAGPQAWGQLHPDWAQCSRGKRQSPIAIDDATTLRGPAEPLAITYRPSTASVVHTGRTLQVDVQGDNSIGVRNTRFRLQQIQFHHPAEQSVNGQGFAMSAHLVHRSADGQMAVLVVLLEPGDANPVIDRVWTYLPLEVGDRVQMPPESLDLAALLPKDLRYYQYLGSLTTPPCTEGVLRLVLKQPVTLSREQLRLFAQLFPLNARPAQPLNGRIVRSAQ